MTCGGTFDTRTGHYDDNIVVFADLVSVTRPPRTREHRPAGPAPTTSSTGAAIRTPTVAAAASGRCWRRCCWSSGASSSPPAVPRPTTRRRPAPGAGWRRRATRPAVVARSSDRVERPARGRLRLGVVGLRLPRAGARARPTPATTTGPSEALARSLEERARGQRRRPRRAGGAGRARHDFVAGRASSRWRRWRRTPTTPPRAASWPTPSSSWASTTPVPPTPAGDGRPAPGRAVLHPGVLPLRAARPDASRRARRCWSGPSRLAVGPGDSAFCLYHLGRLSAGEGDHEAAARALRRGLRLVPGGRGAAVGSRATSLAALGPRRGGGRRPVADVVRAPPAAGLPGRVRRAAATAWAASTRRGDQLAVAEPRPRRCSTAAGSSRTSRSRCTRPTTATRARALASAEANAATRRSVQVEDALAWALHVNGRDEEALVHAEAAAAPGTRTRAVGLPPRDDPAARSADAARRGRRWSRRWPRTPGSPALHAPLARAALADLGRAVRPPARSGPARVPRAVVGGGAGRPRPRRTPSATSRSATTTASCCTRTGVDVT